MAERDLFIVAKSALLASKCFEKNPDFLRIETVDSLRGVLFMINDQSRGLWRTLPTEIEQMQKRYPHLSCFFNAYEDQVFSYKFRPQSLTVIHRGSFERGVRVMQSTYPDWRSLVRACAKRRAGSLV